MSGLAEFIPPAFLLIPPCFLFENKEGGRKQEGWQEILKFFID